jgi:hypothetical protein
MGVANDVVDPFFSSYVYGIVLAAIIDYKPFYNIETRNLPWKGGKGGRQGFGFVITGNLDDKFQSLKSSKSNIVNAKSYWKI